MANVLGVDPGTHECGWALNLHGTLWVVGIARSPQSLTLPERAREMFTVIASEVHQYKVDLGVVERPRVYPKGPEDPNDQMDVSFVAGAMTLLCARIVAPYPRQWKGTLPKAVHHARLREDPATTLALPAVEAIRPAGLQHHVWDAVGLAAWGRKRISR